jgi:hypothetical protein
VKVAHRARAQACRRATLTTARSPCWSRRPAAASSSTSACRRGRRGSRGFCSWVGGVVRPPWQDDHVQAVTAILQPVFARAVWGRGAHCPSDLCACARRFQRYISVIVMLSSRTCEGACVSRRLDRQQFGQCQSSAAMPGPRPLDRAARHPAKAATAARNGSPSPTDSKRQPSQAARLNGPAPRSLMHSAAAHSAPSPTGWGRVGALLLGALADVHRHLQAVRHVVAPLQRGRHEAATVARAAAHVR